MSVILDALRKSEAARQRGQAPGLFVEQGLPARRRRRGLPGWAWALGGVLVAAGAMLAWQAWSPAGGPAPRPAPADGSGREAVAGPAPPPAPATAVPNAPVLIGVQPTGTPPAPPPSPSGAGPSPLATVASPPGPSPVASADRSAAAATAATAAPAVPTDPADPAVSAAPPPAAPPPTAAPLAEDARPPLPPAGEGRGAGPAAGEPLARLADLPAADRSALPPLKLSMHVYADDPAQRFVILDGRRQAEGATLAEGVVLAEIRRDGLVLDAHGRRLLLPRP